MNVVVREIGEDKLYKVFRDVKTIYPVRAGNLYWIGEGNALIPEDDSVDFTITVDVGSICEMVGSTLNISAKK